MKKFTKSTLKNIDVRIAKLRITPFIHIAIDLSEKGGHFRAAALRKLAMKDNGHILEGARKELLFQTRWIVDIQRPSDVASTEFIAESTIDHNDVVEPLAIFA